MQTGKTIIALVALAIIGGFAYYLSLHPPTPTKNRKLFDIDQKKIARIELHGPGRDLLVERNKAGLWHIVKPVVAAADDTAVDALTQAVADLYVTDTVDEHPTDLGEYGLADPATTVTVTTSDQRILPGIMVGKDSPIGGNSYIKMTDSPAVLLVAPGFAAQVSKRLDDLRTRLLFSYTADQVNRVVIAHADGSGFDLVRGKDLAWTMTSPRSYPADAAAVQQLLDMLAGARVAEFVDDHPNDLSRFGLEKPSLTIDLYGGKANAKESLAIGFKRAEADRDAVYARRSGEDQPIATIASYIVKAADKGFDDLRDKSVLIFEPSKVARVTVVGGRVQIVVSRSPDGKWNVTAGAATAPAEQPVIESLLEQLHDLKADRIVENPMTDPKKYGMEHPNLTAVLFDKDAKEIGTVNISQIEMTSGADDATRKPATKLLGFATSSADQAVYLISPDRVTDMENTASRLKEDLSPKSAASTAATPVTSPAAAVAPPAAAAMASPAAS